MSAKIGIGPPKGITHVVPSTGEDGIIVFTLTNQAGMVVRLMNFGAVILDIYVPDGNNKNDNVVLSYDRIGDYRTDDLFVGGIIGRATNRISGGKLVIDGRTWRLSLNEPPGNHLHGGNTGFNKKLWRVTGFVTGDASGSVTMSLISPDGEEGYPGNVTAWVKYSLNADNELSIDYSAISDQPTLVNMTNHSYFNLSGNKNILDHRLSVFSDWYSAADSGHIATGERRMVDDTPFDLRNGKSLKKIIGHIDTLNYCFPKDRKLRPVARLTHEATGRRLDLSSTSPGLQVYGGRHLRGRFSAYEGLCLEPQHYPYLPGGPLEPEMILRPDKVYTETSVYRFSVDKAG